ncbi:MAG: ornithine carbamoyltransferase [Sedimentisphaerales bacterium]|nr:ornithine carbamoyltransferase [Sedimentisphaerales bacterium]
MTLRHFLELREYTAAELADMLKLSAELKIAARGNTLTRSLEGKTAAMLFEKPSSRTRVSFQVALAQLGATAIYLRQEDIGGLGNREPIKDLTRVLNGYVDVVIARVFKHAGLIEMTQYAVMPVVNALSDKTHPCQAMADVLTIQEHCGRLEGLTVAYIGDGNNVAVSLAVACSRFGMKLRMASPPGYEAPAFLFDWLVQEGLGDFVAQMHDPRAAVEKADVVYTDTWVSMGQEAEKQQRLEVFSGYQVNAELLTAAKPGVKVMHCLPAYRGLEITDDVIEANAKVIFDQAENRLHFQRGLLAYLFR